MDLKNKSLLEEKHRLIDRILLVFMVLAIFAVAATVNRMSNLGWNPILYFYLTIILFFALFVYFKENIRLPYKVYFIVAICFFGALGSLSEMGLAGAAKIMFLIMPIIITTFISFKLGLIIGLLNGLILVLAGYSVKIGIWTFPIDFNQYVYSFSAWVGNAISYVALFLVTALIIDKMKGHVDDYILQLNEQHKELESLNNLKDKLFSVISHDLKAPFHGVVYMMRTLVENPNGNSDDEKKKIMQMLLSQSESTYIMLENLLYWARVQQENLEIVKSEVFVKICADQVVKSYLNGLTSKSISLETNIREDLQFIGDKQSFQIVLGNLFNNAVKFTPTNGTIKLKAQKGVNEIIISIFNSGEGINEELKDRLFNPNDFYTSVGTDSEKGTGLGLGLCYELVNKMDGKIWLESKKGKGVTFFLSFTI